MANGPNRWILEAWEKLRELYGPCSCGQAEALDFAHVRRTRLKGESRGRKERYYDIKNNPECYRPMCKDCHKLYDSSREEREYSFDPSWWVPVES